MAGDAGKTGADQSTEKSSIGFSLPFAERAPANPMEVMAAATAAGMALTTQFANAFFGMMQAAMDVTGKHRKPGGAGRAKGTRAAGSAGRPGGRGGEGRGEAGAGGGRKGGGTGGG
mgnify:CR=1 FL=1